MPPRSTADPNDDNIEAVRSATRSSTPAARTTRTNSSSSSSMAATVPRRTRRSRPRSASWSRELGTAKADVDGVSTPTFDQLLDPFQAPPEAGLIAADGTTVRIVGRVPGDSTQVAPLLEPVPAIMDEARTANPDLTIHVISCTFINEDINELISSDLDESLQLTIPLTFIILLFAFGAIVASVVPLVLAITSLVAAFGILGIYSQVVGPVSPNATQLDRPDRARGRGRLLAVHDHALPGRAARRSRPAKAIEISSSTAGRAVFFSGLAVMISLAGLITLACRCSRRWRSGPSRSSLVSVVGSLTFLPATLAILGDRVNLGRPAAWLPRLAVALPLGPISRWGRSALGLAGPSRGAAGGERVLGPAGDLGHGPPGPDDHPLGGLPAPARRAGAPAPDRHHRHHRLPRRRSTASPASSCSNEKWPQGTELQLQVVVTQRRSARDAGRDRDAQDRGPGDRGL